MCNIIEIVLCWRAAVAFLYLTSLLFCHHFKIHYELRHSRNRLSIGKEERFVWATYEKWWWFLIMQMYYYKFTILLFINGFRDFGLHLNKWFKRKSLLGRKCTCFRVHIECVLCLRWAIYTAFYRVLRNARYGIDYN